MSDSDKYYVDDSYHSLKRKLETLGISEWQHMDVRSKSILVVTLWCTDNNIPIPDMRRDGLTCDGFVQMKKEIHGLLRCSGVAQDILENLLELHNKAAILTISAHLQARNIDYEMGWTLSKMPGCAELVQTLKDIIAAVPRTFSTVNRPLRTIRPSASNFKCFPKLLLELRLTIWMEIIRVGRVVQVHEAETKHSAVLTSACPPPITLSICHESRQLALKEYRQRTSRTLDGMSFENGKYPCFFHYTYDTLYFGPRSRVYLRGSKSLFIYNLAEKADRRLLQHLAIATALVPSIPKLEGLELFEDLKTLTYVRDDQVYLAPHEIELEELDGTTRGAWPGIRAALGTSTKVLRPDGTLVVEPRDLEIRSAKAVFYKAGRPDVQSQFGNASGTATLGSSH